MSYIFGIDTGGHKYALQVTTDAPHWGGLGGSTLSEATSWGKVSKKATHEMAFIETSVALPLLYGYALQKDAAKGRKRLALRLGRGHPEEGAEGLGTPTPTLSPHGEREKMKTPRPSGAFDLQRSDAA